MSELQLGEPIPTGIAGIEPVLSPKAQEATEAVVRSDLAYLQAQSITSIGAALPWPAPEALLLKFIAHHLRYPQQRLTSPEHGMPFLVDQSLRDQGFLRSNGPHASDTVRRRLASWLTLTKWRGLDGAIASDKNLDQPSC